MTMSESERNERKARRPAPPASFKADGPPDNDADIVATIVADISQGMPPAAALASALDTAASLDMSPSAAFIAALTTVVSAADQQSAAKTATLAAAVCVSAAKQTVQRDAADAQVAAQVAAQVTSSSIPTFADVVKTAGSTQCKRQRGNSPLAPLSSNAQP